MIRACLERSVEYARERETFGQPIGKYQFVQDMIAKMVLGYETSKLLVMQAAWMKNEGKRNTRETSLAKWHATESAFEAAHLAIQVHGSYGYSAEYGIERYFRNARAPIIYEGTTQIHKMMQAEHALGYRRLNGHTGEMSPLVSLGPRAGQRAPRRRYSSPVEVVELGVLVEQLAHVRPVDPDLAAVRVEAISALLSAESIRMPHRLVGVVADEVRPFRAALEDDAVAGRQFPLAGRVAQRRLAADHDQPLLLEHLPVVGERLLPGRELVEGRADLLGAEQPPDGSRFHCQPGRSRPASSHSSPKD